MRPRICIVVPTLNVESTLDNLNTWAPLTEFADIEAVLVGEAAERDVYSTHFPLKVLAFKRPATLLGRDTNMRRNVGLAYAVQSGADFVFMTDKKVRATPSALVALRQWMLEDGSAGKPVCLAGHYEDTRSHSSWWARFLTSYADNAVIRKNPDFNQAAFTLKPGEEGRTDSWPVTGAFVMSRVSAEALLQAKGFPETFTVSYEDYSAVQTLLDQGITIDCAREFIVEHGNRYSLIDFSREYLRTGWAAAQFHKAFPASSFAARRRTQALAVAVAVATALILLAIAPSVALLLFAFVVISFGLASFYKSRLAHSLLFGPIFAVCAFCYGSGFLLFQLKRGQIGPVTSKVFFQT